MAGTPEGHVESVSTEEATLAGNLGGETEGKIVAPTHVGVEQLRARKQEIDEARQQLVWEYAKVDREIERCGDGGCAHSIAHNVNWRIIEDDGGLSHFAQAS